MKVRQSSTRTITIGGQAVRVRTVVALAVACGVSRITIKRLWEPQDVLPPATFIDARGVRWYSELYVTRATVVVERWRKRCVRERRQKRLSDLRDLLRLKFLDVQ